MRSDRDITVNLSANIAQVKFTWHSTLTVFCYEKTHSTTFGAAVAAAALLLRCWFAAGFVLLRAVVSVCFVRAFRTVVIAVCHRRRRRRRYCRRRRRRWHSRRVRAKTQPKRSW